MLSLWRRLPVLVRAVVSGLVLASVVTVPWGVLVSMNLQYWSMVPWAVPPVLLYLWVWWQYVSGRGWPASTSKARHANLRARPVSDDVWGAALLAGVLGLTTSVLIANVVQRLARVPEAQRPDISHVPVLTLLCFLLTGAAVAGIVEEGSFRGYMQGRIERRHGPVIAIAVTALSFAFAHSQNPEFSLSQVPFYLSLAATFGTLAYLTNSILPGMVLHVSAVVLQGIGDLARRGQSWLTSPSPAPTIWETGPDVSFWVSCGAVLIVGSATVWAYLMLAAVVGKTAEPTLA